MSRADSTFVYVATYPDEATAREDYQVVKDLHAGGLVGSYDAAVVTRDAKGRIHENKDETATRHGAWWGVAAGAVVGLIFPPSVIGAAALGGVIGGVGGHLSKGMSRSRAKELGDFIGPGEAGLIVVGEGKVREAIQKAVTRAERETAEELDVEPQKIDKTLQGAVREMLRPACLPRSFNPAAGDPGVTASSAAGGDGLLVEIDDVRAEDGAVRHRRRHAALLVTAGHADDRAGAGRRAGAGEPRAAAGASGEAGAVEFRPVRAVGDRASAGDRPLGVVRVAGHRHQAGKGGGAADVLTGDDVTDVLSVRRVHHDERHVIGGVGRLRPCGADHDLPWVPGAVGCAPVPVTRDKHEPPAMTARVNAVRGGDHQVPHRAVHHRSGAEMPAPRPGGEKRPDGCSLPGSRPVPGGRAPAGGPAQPGRGLYRRMAVQASLPMRGPCSSLVQQLYPHHRPGGRRNGGRRGHAAHRPEHQRRGNRARQA